ncbi:class I SAM-dependent methyltransferase [Actinomadura opuntiae]|uniref:class I SAM-dependent methyltransferase n=1 Tax=Actinomadura sp. OS1-43 TaxID=604315 RepID=UPI00255B1B45|nr:class I SAM-dependent methyltransferase [Actinomadura sp. OS1-43]MDL4820253.1 class I SAM-dependent methyltransferase [Actinomadura sp. OS1-43]
MTAPGLRCPLCRGTRTRPWARARDLEYFTTEDEFAYHRCPDCRLVFIDPVPADRLAEIYPASYYSYGPPDRSFAARVKQRLDAAAFRHVLARVPGAAVNVLDVGGGDGAHLSMIRELEPRTALTQVVDLDERAGRLARARGHRYHQGRIEDFAPPELFGLILLVNLIEHVADPAAVLAALRRCLAPGGVILVKTPNTASLDARLFRHRNWGGLHCPRHWRLFDRGNFTRLAASAGLRVDRFRHTQGAPFWTASVLAWLAGRGLVRLSAARPVVRHPLYPVLTPLFAAFDFIRTPLGGRPSQMFFELAADDRAEELTGQSLRSTRHA